MAWVGKKHPKIGSICSDFRGSHKSSRRKVNVIVSYQLGLISLGTLVLGQIVSSIEVPDEQVVYKKVGEVNLHLDVFKPKGRQAGNKCPCMVFFFGGGWTGGTPSQFYPHAQYLASRGMVAISVEYRVSS